MRKFLTALLATGMLLALVACSSNTPAPSEGETTPTDTTMHIEVTTAPVGLHPLKTNDAPSTALGNQIFETLYVRDASGTSYSPLLAAEMPIYSEDGLTATIKLREGVTFHDGTPFTAEAVGYMIDSLKDPDYGSQRPSIVESIVSYDIVDDHTIDLHLAYVDGVLVAKLAHTNGAIVNPALDQSQDLLIDATGAGTGPYEFVSSIPGSTYTLKANENYWGGEPEVKEVVFDVVADESTAIARLQTGEADFYATVAADSYNTANNIPGYTLVNKSNSSIYYLVLRSTEETSLNPLMANLDFRKTIVQAIDFDTFVDTMMNGLASRSQSIVGPTLVGYTSAMEEAGYKYDPEAAKATVEANGWSGEKVTIFCATREWQQDLAVYVQAQLQAVGLDAEIVSEEWASFLSDAREDKKCDVIFLSWSNVTGDGQQMLEPNFSTTNGVRVKYNNAEFDEMVQNSVLTTVQEEREQYMLQAVNKIQGDAICTPIYSPNTLYCYNSDKFDNVSVNFDVYQIKDFKVK